MTEAEVAEAMAAVERVNALTPELRAALKTIGPSSEGDIARFRRMRAERWAAQRAVTS